MIRVYTGKKSLALFLALLAGTFLLLSLFFWGVTRIIQLFLPLLVCLSYLLIIIFVLGVLPLTSLKYMRPSLCKYSIMMSHILGASTWMMSFFIVIKAFGLLGILFIFIFKYMGPIAILGAMLKGSWHVVGHLIVWISFTYGMKYYSQWLSNFNPLQQGKGRIIDVDAIEVRNP